MIALSMVMLDVFAQGAPQGALAEEDDLGLALLLYRPDPALRNCSSRVRRSASSSCDGDAGAVTSEHGEPTGAFSLLED
jgi:hypothetical protein